MPPTYGLEESRLAYHQFSSMCIIIKQVISMIKDWAATCETLHLPTTHLEDLYEFHHCVWTVVSVFVNMYCRV